MGLAACLVVLLTIAPLYLHGRPGMAWSLAPLQPGLAHFGTDGHDLVAVWASGEVAILDVATGQPRVASQFASAFPLLAEPAVFDGKAVFGSDDGRVRELNLATGAVAWEFVTGATVRAKPERAGDLLLIGSDDGALYGLQEATGLALWRAACGGKIGAQAALCGASSAVVGTADNGIIGVTWGPVPLPAGTQGVGVVKQWRVRTEAPALAPAAAARGGEVGAVGTDEGRLYLLDPATGNARGMLEMNGLVRCRPVVLADRVLAADCSGRVVAAGLDGKPLWARRVAGPITTGLVVQGDTVFLGTARGEVVALRISDGQRVWHCHLPGAAAGSLQVTGGLVIAGLSEGRICAFRLPPESS